MKKLIILIMCFFSINVVYAEVLEYEYLPYYVKLTKGDIDIVIQVKKVYDKDSSEVVFNMDPNNYEIKSNYIKNSEINYNNYGKYHSNVGFFNTIVYYGYNKNKNDLNYFYTQVMVWDLINNYYVSIIDSAGNELSDLMKEYRLYWNKALNHNQNPIFHNKEYSIDLWDTLNLKYSNIDNILDNPEIDGLTIKNEGTNLYVYANKFGKYKVEFTKNYDEENYSYSDGETFYWQNLGGPSDIYKYFYLNVSSVNLSITENIIGINGRIGDAKLNSSYELYLDDKFQLVIKDLFNNNVKSNSKYVLKDSSENIGIHLNEDIEFSVLNTDYNLIIDKYVIAKNISVSVLDNFTYYVYLKSSNELYETIDSKTNLITLPYGTYYIICKDNNYYQEIEVINDIDDLLVIDNSIKEKVDTEEIVVDKNNNSKVENDEEEKEIVVENNKINEDNLINNDLIDDIENPKTIDNINCYLSLFLISFILIVVIRRNVLDD